MKTFPKIRVAHEKYDEIYWETDVVFSCNKKENIIQMWNNGKTKENGKIKEKWCSFENENRNKMECDCECEKCFLVEWIQRKPILHCFQQFCEENVIISWKR